MTDRYSKVAIALHWLIAILMIGNFIGAQVAEGLGEEAEHFIMGNHKAFGIIVLLLTVVRIAWRLGHRPPPLDSHLKMWEKGLAHATHALFYIMMLALPITGWMMTSAHPKAPPISIFGLFDFPKLPILGDKMLGGIGHEGHEIMGTLLLVTVALHILGALKHSIIDKRPSLSRMTFRGPRA